jgi:hypothetical protein
MKLKAIAAFIVSMVLGIGFLSAAGSYQISGYLPKVEKSADALTIRIDTLQDKKDFYIYFRTDGLKHYQVRKMKRDKTGNVYYQLATANLYGKKMEYFVVESEKELSNSMTPVFTIAEITDKDSPEIYFQETQEGAAPGGKKRDPLFKIGASVSSNTQLHDDSEFPGKKFDANGNLRLYRNISNEKYQFDFDTNFAYMHNPSDTEEKFNLSEMKVNYKRNGHSVAAGDLSINNTEFTTSFLNRRGVHYQLEHKLLFVDTFFANAQQKTGFDGFGIPPSEAHLFGATAGVNIGNILKVRGMFMTGKDNLDSKTVVSSDDVVREGTVLSVWGEMSLLQNKLTLKGEFARSNFGRAADSASLTKEADTAWRGEADFTHGVVSAHADYKKVGEKYSSIANLFLQNDREGLSSNIGVMIKSFALNVRYMDQKTNLNSTVTPMLHTKNIGADVNWLIANHFQLGAEFSLDNLDYDKSSGLMTGSEDMDTIRYAGTVGYIAGSNGITVKLGKTESKNFTSNIDGTVALNLRFGNVLSINPTVSYQSTENFTDDSTSKIYSAYLNSELTFIQEWLSFTFSGSWVKNDNSISESTQMTMQGNLNLFLTKLFNSKIQPSLSLKGKYERFESDGTENDNVTLYLQADLSF